nr:tRNA pseudouridine(38-40) synthase TruA [Anaerolineae bacterium]
MRFKATVAYDGTAYHGYQKQENAFPTIQEEIENALLELVDRPVLTLVAGRTDAGVHATGQVVAFDLEWKHSDTQLRHALNAGLPEDVVIREVQRVSPHFHPRFDALSRTYVYRIYQGVVRDPLRRMRAWHLMKSLDLAALNEAAQHLNGEHDFSTFGTPPQGDNPVRVVAQAEWKAVEPDELHFTITANAFLFRMVRSLVGTLVLVGQHRMTPEEFRDILAARDRNLSGTTAPPYGLTLVAVNYGP